MRSRPYALGDRSPREMGRLTLNPLAHLDPLGSLDARDHLLQRHSFLFGWAKPVLVDPRNLRTSPQVGWRSSARRGRRRTSCSRSAAGAVWAHTELTGDALEIVYCGDRRQRQPRHLQPPADPAARRLAHHRRLHAARGLRAVVGARPVRHVRRVRARHLLQEPTSSLLGGAFDAVLASSRRSSAAPVDLACRAWTRWQRRRRAAPARAAPGATVIAFTTRQGGVSDGSFASLNLGFATPDDPAAVAENRRRALAAAGADPRRAASLRQRHGARRRRGRARVAPAPISTPP